MKAKSHNRDIAQGRTPSCLRVRARIPLQIGGFHVKPEGHTGIFWVREGREEREKEGDPSRRRRVCRGTGKIKHVWEVVRSSARLGCRILRRKRSEMELEG